MSSGLWKKIGKPGIFGGGHKKNPFGPSHDPMMDGAQDWDELEKEYYKDFDRRIANPVDHQYEHEDQPTGINQAENISHLYTSRDIEEAEDQETPVDNTEIGGAPYREEAMKLTDIRRGGHKRLTDLISTRFSNRFSRGSKPPPETRPVDCPESGCKVCFGTCTQCSKFQVWDEQDDGLPRCYHEYRDLKSRGHYENTVGDPPSEEELESFSQAVETERLRLEKKGPSKELKEARKATSKFFKFEYGDFDEDYEKDEGDFDGDNDHERDYDDEEEYY